MLQWSLPENQRLSINNAGIVGLPSLDKADGIVYILLGFRTPSAILSLLADT
jgi:hypothetical protein